MKRIFVITALVFAFGTVQANDDFLNELEFLRKSCANKVSDLKKIKGITSKASLWGVWKGKWDGENFEVTFSKKSGRFKGKVVKGSSKYGPYGVRLCDYGKGKFTGSVLGYEAQFKVLGKKKLQVISPDNPSDKVIVRKIKDEK